MNMDLVPSPQRAVFGEEDGPLVDVFLARALEECLLTGTSTEAIRMVLDSDVFTEVDGVGSTAAGQGYRLSISADGITLSAAAQAGLFYGLQTLRQLVDLTGQGNRLPAVTIHDWPDLEWRGLQLDIARRMTYRHEHVKDIIRQMSALKMNMLHLYLEGSFAFPSQPALHQDSFMTPEQAKDLCTFAAGHHVTLIPQVNCLGHMRQLLDAEENIHLREDPEDGYMICPSHPETLPFVFALLDDLADAFDTPFIHIGMDEAGKLGTCPQCRKRVDQDGHAGGLLAEYTNAIAAHLRKRGRRALMWGDMLLDKMRFPGTHAANGGVTGWGSQNMTCRALGLLDPDIIICDWQYAYFMPEEMQAIRAAGHDIMPAPDTDERVCPWGPKRGLDFHLRNFFDAAKENGAIGGFATTWSLYMGEYFHNRWLDFGKAAESLWSSRHYEPAEFADRFGRVFFGIDGGRLAMIDQCTKIDVLPETMRLVPNVMKQGDPWAVLRPPKGASDPVTPIGNPSEVIGMKSACLVQCRMAPKLATRRAHLLQVLDIPLQVDIFVMRCFHLKSSIRSIYAFANRDQSDRLAGKWARDALLTGLHGLRDDACGLRERFLYAYREYGNNPADIDAADAFITEVERMIGLVREYDELPPIEAWCPAPLRP